MIYPARMLVKPDKKVAYFFMPKAGTNSIARTFMSTAQKKECEKECEQGENYFTALSLLKMVCGDYPPQAYERYGWRPVFEDLQGLGYYWDGQPWQVLGYDRGYYKKPIDIATLNSHFIFTFVRNPFTRLVSFFQNKLIYDSGKNKFTSHPLRHIMQVDFTDFASFVQTLSAQRDEEMDEHVRPQTSMLSYLTDRGGKFDFIGKLENLARDFEPMRQKFDLQPLEKLNSSSVDENVLHERWQDYYTPELAAFVYERYKKDFQQLGYQDEYPKLLSWLQPSVRKKVQRFGRTLFSKAAHKKHSR